jgi:hypothetical protein
MRFSHTQRLGGPIANAMYQTRFLLQLCMNAVHYGVPIACAGSMLNPYPM